MVKFNTLLVRGGRPNDNTTGAVNVPIYNSSTFRYPKLGSDVKWDYERSGNPTRDAVEDVCAALEMVIGALLSPAGWRPFTRHYRYLSREITSSLAIIFTVGLFGWSMIFSNRGVLNLPRLILKIPTPWRQPFKTIPRAFILSR